MLLIARKQYHLSFTLFQQDKYQLKKRIKPVYFALMNLMQDDYPKEFKKMGTEIKDTVDEVLYKIRSLDQYKS